MCLNSMFSPSLCIYQLDSEFTVDSGLSDHAGLQSHWHLLSANYLLLVLQVKQYNHLGEI